MAYLRVLSALSLAAVTSACVADNEFYVSPTSESSGASSTTAPVGSSTSGVATTAETSGETTAETSGETTAETTGGPVCGDGAVNGDEDCDDGASNGTPNSACLASCEAASCGDGVVSLGEACDDGAANGGPQSMCSSWCTPPACGDAELTKGEACDHGEANITEHSFTCLENCVENACGDGILAPAEMCEPSLFANECADDCTLMACGDGQKTNAEECDPPNGAECSVICRLAPTIAPYGLPLPGGGVGDIAMPLGVSDCSKLGVVGVHGSFDLDELVVAQVGAICGVHETTPIENQYEVTHGGHYNDAKFGEAPAQPKAFGLKCPNNKVLTGLMATSDVYVEKLALLCSDVRAVNIGSSWEVFVHPWELSDMVGDLFADDDLVEIAACDPGMVVAQLFFLGDGEITGIDFDCIELIAD
ncbi:MAG: hypothetical protein KC486_17005 [Myxococcales bacterium]|nr:hypothetical protein [Myxococcales bacterium]